MKKILLIIMITILTATSGLALEPKPLDCKNCLHAYLACIQNYDSEICISNYWSCRQAGCTVV